MTRRALLFVAALTCVHCAAGRPRPTPRDYVREGLSEIPLQSVVVVGVAKTTYRPKNAAIDPSVLFQPPRDDEALDAGMDVDEAISEQLQSAMAAVFRARGFTVLKSAARPTDTLRVVRKTEADAVALVRAVPIDQPYLLEETAETQLITTLPGDDAAAPGLPQAIAIANLTPGRLFLGQVFLFDAKTGARLWSRQLPGFPADAQLRKDAEILAYGVVGDEAESMSPKVLGPRAAEAFARAVAKELPSPAPGTEAGAARLAEIDIELEQRAQRFFDRQHLAFDLGVAWSFEHFGGEAFVPAIPEPLVQELGTGAFAPSGGLLVQPRFTWITPNRLTFTAFGTLGTIPDSSFQRRVFSDGSSPGVSDDALITQSVSGGAILGAGLGGGYLLSLSNTLLLHLTAAVFLESWQFEVAFLESADHVRVGAEARGDLWWLPFGPPFLLRAGLHGRLGVDSAGPLFFGGGPSVGVGFLL